MGKKKCTCDKVWDIGIKFFEVKESIITQKSMRIITAIDPEEHFIIAPIYW